MKKTLIATFAAAASVLAAGAAHAGNVYWSVGISAPAVGTVISNAPVYAPAPVVVAPPPVVYAPAPVYAPPPVVYRPAPRVVYEQPVVVSRPVPIVYGGYHGAYGDRDRDGIPNYRDRHDNRGHWDRDRDGIPDWRDHYDNRRHHH